MLWRPSATGPPENHLLSYANEWLSYANGWLSYANSDS